MLSTKITNETVSMIDRLKKEMEAADAIIIGAGAGLSTSAGFTYSGSCFHENFSDFEEKYCFHDMYSGGLLRHYHFWLIKK